jgi:arylsulfatase A-like enzyme
MPNYDQPNVIVFFTDQQRWDTTGIHGNPLNLTPNFDRLAKQGTHLYHSFTCQPLCGPARSCLQTGLYPTTSGVFRNDIPLSNSDKSLAYHFNKGGYHTGYIGKWHLAGRESPDDIKAAGAVPEELRAGYHFWLGANLLELTSSPYSTILYDGNNQPVLLPGYRVDALTDAAIRYINDHQMDPFFLFLSFLEPHQQNNLDDYPPPEGYRELYVGKWTPPDLAALGGSTQQHIAGYYGMVKRLDEALGRLIDCLISLKLNENTIILFTSDHGNHFKTRNREYKRSCHESSIRVPTMISGPGFNGGGQIRDLVSIVDLPLTLLDAVGITIPSKMQGRSILPLVRHEPIDWRNELLIQISELQLGRAIRTKRWKYCVTANDLDPYAFSSSEHYQEYALYDLKTDPYELTNLIGFESHREIANILRQRLIDCMVEAGEDAPEINTAPSISSLVRGRYIPIEEAWK